MKTVVAVTRFIKFKKNQSLGISDRKSGIYIFHFKGVCFGFEIKEICVEIEAARFTEILIKNQDYLLYIVDVKIMGSQLLGKVTYIKDLQECSIKY